MKSLFITIGILLSLPIGASAASCPSAEGVSEILNLKPVSQHYTKKVIERAENGIAYANSFSDETLSIALLFYPWLTEITSAITQLVDTDLRLTQEERSLRQHTACLFVDLVLIEAEMEKVRCELSSETLSENKINIGKIIRLKALLLFLNDRYRNLILGANDPTYEDRVWQQFQIFDNPDSVWCAIMYGSDEENNTCKKITEDQCWGEGGGAIFDTEKECLSTFGLAPENEDAEKEKRMCPFHSDYLPPTAYGYGCDKEILKSYSSYTPVKEEYEAFKDLIDARNEFIEDSADLKQLIIDFNQFTGHEVPNLDNFGAGLNREHKEFTGCIDKVEDPETETEKAQRNIIFQKGGTRWELRGPFSIQKDEIKLMTEFIQLRSFWGKLREQSDELKFPLEFKNKNDREDAEEREDTLPLFVQAIRNFSRPYMTKWNMRQAARESTIIAKVHDAQLQTLGELERVHEESRTLAMLASNMDMGGRNFTRKFAWFLRSSCIYRPCNLQLNNVLKYTFEDTCFPFANGEDIKYQVANINASPSNKKFPDNRCKKEAEPFCIMPGGGIGKVKQVSGTVEASPDSGLNDLPSVVFKCESL